MTITMQSLAPAKINATTLAIKSASIGAGIISEADRHSGNLFSNIVRVSGAEPIITLQVPFAAAFSLIGFGSLNVTTLEIWLATFATYERQTTGTKWDLAASATAVATITDWSVGKDGLLLATVTIAPLSSNGSTHPLVQGSGTLPTLAGQPALHTLGPISVNGGVIAGNMSAGGELGHALSIYRGDGDRYPTNAARVGGAPKISAEMSDAQAALTSISLLGDDVSSNVVQYFRSYNATTGEVTVTGGTGISLTIASGRISWEQLAANMLDLPRLRIDVEGLSTSSAHPIAVNLSATVP